MQGTGATEGRPLRPQRDLSCCRAEFPSSQAGASARFPGHPAQCPTLLRGSTATAAPRDPQSREALQGVEVGATPQQSSEA